MGGQWETLKLLEHVIRGRRDFRRLLWNSSTGDGVDDREALSLEPGRAVPSLDLRQELLA